MHFTASENRILRIISRLERNEIKGGWRKQFKKNIKDPYSSQNYLCHQIKYDESDNA
jgi:hypothetical protein